MLTVRQEQLFKDILDKYIKTSEPVGSKLIARSKRWNVSSATLRNEMTVLEKEGFIVQPYTSAGRVPTEKGYQYYRDQYLKPTTLNTLLIRALEESFTGSSTEGLKSLARELSSISELAVITGLGDNDLYYTGIRHLIEQPEFDSRIEVHEILAALEEHEEEIFTFFDTLPQETAILIGSENPILSHCSIIAAPIMIDNKRYFISILGPMRMQYPKMVSLIHRCTTLIIH
jgi:transcriptional regulator of heat shock response